MSDISKHVVVKTQGWKHAYSDTLFATKEEADYDWASWILRAKISDCSTYNELDVDTLLASIPSDDDLRKAFGVLGTYQIKYPR